MNSPDRGILALVLARAGSKGAPGKNVADVAGRPCIAWTLDAAQQCSAFTRVVVSTDDPKVVTVARASGVEAIDRPPHLASDIATVDDAARDAISRLGHSGPVAILYANVPVRPEGLFDRAAALLRDSSCDSVQSFASVGKYHPWWMTRIEPATGALTPWEGDVLFHGVFRRQELPPAYVPDGAVTIVTRRAFFRDIPGVPDGPHAFLGKDRRAVTTPEGSVVDIDSPVDLLVADAVLRERRRA